MKLLLCLLLVSCTTPKSIERGVLKVLSAKRGDEPVKIPKELKL